MNVSDDGKFRFKIKETSLILRSVKISRFVLLKYANALAKATAKYPITHVEVESFQLHTVILGDTLENVILGHLLKESL